MSDEKVKVQSTPECPYCVEPKARLGRMPIYHAYMALVGLLGSLIIAMSAADFFQLEPGMHDFPGFIGLWTLSYVVWMAVVSGVPFLHWFLIPEGFYAYIDQRGQTHIHKTDKTDYLRDEHMPSGTIAPLRNGGLYGSLSDSFWTYSKDVGEVKWRVYFFDGEYVTFNSGRDRSEIRLRLPVTQFVRYVHLAHGVEDTVFSQFQLRDLKKMVDREQGQAAKTFVSLLELYAYAKRSRDGARSPHVQALRESVAHVIAPYLREKDLSYWVSAYEQTVYEVDMEVGDLTCDCRRNKPRLMRMMDGETVLYQCRYCGKVYETDAVGNTFRYLDPVQWTEDMIRSSGDKAHRPEASEVRAAG